MGQSIAFDVIARDKASTTFNKIGKSSDSAGSRLGKFGKTATLAFGAIGGAAIGAGAISFLKSATAEAREAQKIGAQTTAVLKSTGNAANTSAKQIGNLATAISNKSGIDDEAIQSASNLLLTFTNLRNEVGKGNDIFNQATQAATDMGAAMGNEPKAAAIQLGKALNDPIKGVTALTKVGVTFTAQQKDQIKALVESGDRMSAQKIILKELNKEFGGSAAAQATAGDKARVAWGNLQEQIGTGLLPVIDRLATFTSNEVVPAVSSFVAGMQDGTGAGGELAATIGDIASVAKGAAKAVDSLPGPVKKFGLEALVAYVALRKLTGITSSVGASLTAPIARFKQFGAEMTYTETRSAKLKSSMRSLGAGMRNAAGLGGALALTNGLQGLNKESSSTDTALSGLKTAAGAAALGFAVGGPLGAAIGGTGGSLYAMVKTFGLFGTAAQKAATVSLPSWKQYEQTLGGVTAATTTATRAMVLQRLEESGLLKATRALGLSDREAVNAMTGSHAARVKLTNAMRTSTKITNDQKDALAKETGAVGASRLAQLRHNVAIAGSARELKLAKEALRKFMAAPASKRVSITGAEDAVARINSIRDALNQVFAVSKDVQYSLNGLGTLPRSSTGSTTTERTAIAPSVIGGRMVVGVLEVIHKTPDGKVIERELVELKNTRGGRQLEFVG